jgi:hypothetical protein
MKGKGLLWPSLRRVIGVSFQQDDRVQPQAEVMAVMVSRGVMPTT